jgi:hypothetical protein
MPFELEQMARSLIECTSRPWPSEAEGAKPVEWLEVGSGCTARTGTVKDVHSAARSAQEAVMSILVELPIERPEDELVLLDLLVRSRWDIPRHQRRRTARRVARFVSNAILREAFRSPVEAGAQ